MKTTIAYAIMIFLPPLGGAAAFHYGIEMGWLPAYGLTFGIWSAIILTAISR